MKSYKSALIISDNLITQITLANSLRNFGITDVFESLSMDTAMSISTKEYPDYIFIDTENKSTDWNVLFKEIRAFSPNPITFISQDQKAETINDELGPFSSEVEIVSKPIQPDLIDWICFHPALATA